MDCHNKQIKMQLLYAETLPIVVFQVKSPQLRSWKCIMIDAYFEGDFTFDLLYYVLSKCAG